MLYFEVKKICPYGLHLRQGKRWSMMQVVLSLRSFNVPRQDLPILSRIVDQALSLVALSGSLVKLGFESAFSLSKILPRDSAQESVCPVLRNMPPLSAEMGHQICSRPSPWKDILWHSLANIPKNAFRWGPVLVEIFSLLYDRRINVGPRFAYPLHNQKALRAFSQLPVHI